MRRAPGAGRCRAVYGHEAAGRVTATGPEGARRYAAGDRVLVTLIRACGACPACAAGAPTSCEHAWDPQPSPLRDAADAMLARGMDTAAFAEAVWSTGARSRPCPTTCRPTSPACLPACLRGRHRGRGGGQRCHAAAGSVGRGGRRRRGRAERDPGRGARRRRAYRRGRRERGEARRRARLRRDRRGAGGPGAGEAIRALNGGRGVGAAVVTVGSAEAIGAAAGYLGAGGTLVVVGMPPSGTRVPFDPTTLAATNRSIVGARMGRAVLARDIRRLIGEWRAGRLKLAELVSARYPLEEINTAIAATTARAARRNVIVFEGSYG